MFFGSDINKRKRASRGDFTKVIDVHEQTPLEMDAATPLQIQCQGHWKTDVLVFVDTVDL